MRCGSPKLGAETKDATVLGRVVLNRIIASIQHEGLWRSRTECVEDTYIKDRRKVDPGCRSIVTMVQPAESPGKDLTRSFRTNPVFGNQNAAKKPTQAARSPSTNDQRASASLSPGTGQRLGDQFDVVKIQNEVISSSELNSVSSP
jgi:hypothetical protein